MVLDGEGAAISFFVELIKDIFIVHDGLSMNNSKQQQNQGMRGETTIPEQYRSRRATLPVIQSRERRKVKTPVQRSSGAGGRSENEQGRVKQWTKKAHPQNTRDLMSAVEGVPLRYKTENVERSYRRRKLVDVDVVRQIIMPIKHIKTKSNKRVPYMKAFNTRLENMRLAQRLLRIKASEDVSKKEHHRFYCRHKQHVEMLMHDGEEVMITNYNVIRPRLYLT